MKLTSLSLSNIHIPVNRITSEPLFPYYFVVAFLLPSTFVSFMVLFVLLIEFYTSRVFSTINKGILRWVVQCVPMCLSVCFDPRPKTNYYLDKHSPADLDLELSLECNVIAILSSMRFRPNNTKECDVLAAKYVSFRSSTYLTRALNLIHNQYSYCSSQV